MRTRTLIFVAWAAMCGCGRTEIVGPPQGTTAGTLGTTNGTVGTLGSSGATSATVSITGTITTSGTSGTTTTTGGGTECSACNQDGDCVPGGACVLGKCAEPCQADGSCKPLESQCVPVGNQQRACVSFCTSGTGGPGGIGATTTTGSGTTTSTTGPLTLGITGGTTGGGTSGGGGACAPCASSTDCASGYACVAPSGQQGLCLQTCGNGVSCAYPTTFCVSAGSGQICVPQNLCGLGGNTGGGGGGFGGGTGGGPCQSDNDCFGRQTCCQGICSDTACGLCGETCAAAMCDPSSRCRRTGACTCHCPDGTNCPDPSVGTASCANPPTACPPR